ncbi:hypothetical protein DFQ26_007281, partial [Actinomortierella ambigua]
SVEIPWAKILGLLVVCAVVVSVLLSAAISLIVRAGKQEHAERQELQRAEAEAGVEGSIVSDKKND